MGGAVTIGLLMMTSGAMNEGLWVSAGAWESARAWLDVSSGLEVLALFGGTRCIDGSGGWEVGHLRVKYRCWGGLEGTPPSEDGMVRAWKAWDGFGGAWPSLARCGRVSMAPSGVRHTWYGQEAKIPSSWRPQGAEWRGICFARRQWVFRNRGWLCEIVSWRPLNRDFKWLLVSFLAIRSKHKWPLAFHMGFAWLVTDAKIFAVG